MVTRVPRVTVITTGGTIASAIDPATGVAVPVMSGADLAALLPGIDRRAEITVHEHSLLPSINVTPTFMLELSHVTAALLDAGADGIVISHGTDTLEETAFWLDLTLDIGTRRAPVVLTGAMRHNSQIGADGPRNLFDAVTVA